MTALLGRATREHRKFAYARLRIAVLEAEAALHDIGGTSRGASMADMHLERARDHLKMALDMARCTIEAEVGPCPA